MNNVHVHLHVSNLEESVRFYESFFGSPPVKLKPDYAKFLPELAPLNLALSAADSGIHRNVDHLGFQVESRALVMSALARVKAAGLEVREEMGTDCCYANEDKFWVRDPDGIEWEVYHLNYDLEDGAPMLSARGAGATACCAPGTVGCTPTNKTIGRRPL